MPPTSGQCEPNQDKALIPCYFRASVREVTTAQAVTNSPLTSYSLPKTFRKAYFAGTTCSGS